MSLGLARGAPGHSSVLTPEESSGRAFDQLDSILVRRLEKPNGILVSATDSMTCGRAAHPVRTVTRVVTQRASSEAVRRALHPVDQHAVYGVTRSIGTRSRQQVRSKQSAPKGFGLWSLVIAAALTLGVWVVGTQGNRRDSGPRQRT